MTVVITSAEDQVAKALSRLASEGSSQAIAERLKFEGVKGAMNHRFDCPIANWVKKEAGYGVAINGLDWRLVVSADVEVFSGARLMMPDAVFDFIRDFDEGRYPELRGEGGVATCSCSGCTIIKKVKVENSVKAVAATAALEDSVEALKKSIASATFPILYLQEAKVGGWTAAEVEAAEEEKVLVGV